MPIIPLTTIPQKGMVTDLHPQYLAEGSYIYALNAQIEQAGDDGYLLQNTSSNFLSIKFPEGYSVVGFKHILEQNRVLWFLTNGTLSQIGETVYETAEYDTRPLNIISNIPCLNCQGQGIHIPEPLEKIVQSPVLTYIPIVTSSCLNFSIYFPIDVEYKITDCTVQVYFVDGHNPDRYIYFDYDPAYPHRTLTLQDKFSLNGSINCSAILFQPIIHRPQIELDEVFSGGSLKRGVYQFVIGYATSDGSPLSSYYGMTQIIPVHVDNYKANILETDQAIRLKISNVSTDLVFKHYNIIVAETINSVTEYKLVGTYPITQNLITYAGNEQLQRMSINDVLQKYPYYKFSNSITKSNQYLFRSGLTEFPILNLQRAVNKVKVGWETIAINEKAYKDPKHVNELRTYQRDEVYPLGLVFEMAEGGDSPVYHIPGRVGTLDDFRTLTIDELKDSPFTDDECSSPEELLYWKVYNTGTVIGTPAEDPNNCEYAVHQYGDLAYWESTELYPDDENIWGDLAGKPIRHPKMPDSGVTHIHSNNPNISTDPVNAFSQENIIYPIAFRIDHDSIKQALLEAIEEGYLSQEDYNRIKGYRVVRGNRANNKSIVAKGMLYDMWDYTKKGTKYYYPNYPYNDLNADPFIAKNDHVKEGVAPVLNTWTPSNRYTFHSPDTSFTQPTPGTILKIETEELGISKGHYVKVEDHAKYKFLTNEAFNMARWFGAAIGSHTDVSDGTSELSNLGSNLGSTLGTAVGGPIGGILGSVAGSMLGGILNNNIGGNNAFEAVAKAMTQVSLAIHNMDKVLQLLTSLSAFHNYFVSYNSVGRYIGFNVRPNLGQKQRRIENSSYLRPEMTSVTEGTSSIVINNYNRESSLYLKTATDIIRPVFPDFSRFTISNKYLCSDWENKDALAFINSFYATVKNYRPSQYGAVYGVEYLETNGDSYGLGSSGYSRVFGGDTYINRFSLKRKMPFFTATPFKLPDNTDFQLSDFANVGYPVYYANTQGTDDTAMNQAIQFFRPVGYNNSSSISSILGVALNGDAGALASSIGLGRIPKINIDCEEPNTAPGQQWIVRKGIIYLYSYGIPSFIVESDINIDYRYNTDNAAGDYYPRQQDINYWLSETNVPLREDNTYNYDKTYSKQIKESAIFPLAPENLLGNCQVIHENRVVYSDQSEIVDRSVNRDSWLIYKANNMWDFSKVNGKLISVEGIENDKVLVRFENTFQIFNSYTTIKTSADDIQVGNGGMFQSKPQEWAKADLGYGGTQHRDILHTEFGHVMIDAKRGQVFIMSGNDLDEISKEGMKNWFANNLPLQITKYIPNLPYEILDNTYFGIGVTTYYDRIRKTLYITKLDYKPKRKGINFSFENGFFVIEEGEIVKVSLKDKNLFEDVSWTISYNFYNKSWVSFHSFLPNFAISNIDHFLTGENKTGTVWAHNVSTKSYQVYYGKKYPFIIEAHLNVKSFSNLNAIEYAADVLFRQDGYSTIRVSTLPFSKMYVTTDTAGSGELRGVVANKNDMSQSFSYPKIEGNHHKILVSNKDSAWRFNQFSNLYQSNHSIWSQSGMSKVINPVFSYNKSPINYAPIKGNWVRVMLVNENNTNYSTQVKWVQCKVTPSTN